MPNPEGERQTNNAAELFAALRVLEHFSIGKIVIALDSKIVNDAMKGGAQKLKDNGWRCTTGPVGNVHCSSVLLQFELQRSPPHDLRQCKSLYQSLSVLVFYIKQSLVAVAQPSAFH